jgi:hypothetical protein
MLMGNSRTRTPAASLTLNGPSMRGVCRPIGDVVAVWVIVGIYNIRQAVCVTSFRACIRQRFASSALNPFWLCGFASRSAASAAF